MRRVVVTGYGSISSSGQNVYELWNNVSSGISGIKKIESPEFSDSTTKFGGLVDNYDIEKYLDKNEVKRTDRFTHFAIIGAMQALEHAMFKKGDFDLEKCGVFIGTGIGGIHSHIENQKVLMEKGSRRV